MEPPPPKKMRVDSSTDTSVAEKLPEVQSVVGKRVNVPVDMPVPWLDTLLLSLFYSDGFVACVQRFADEPDVKSNGTYTRIAVYVRRTLVGRRTDNSELAEGMESEHLRDELLLTNVAAGILQDCNAPPSDVLKTLSHLIAYLDELVTPYDASCPFASLFGSTTRWSYNCLTCAKDLRATLEELTLFWRIELPQEGDPSSSFESGEGHLSTEELYRHSLRSMSKDTPCPWLGHEQTVQRSASPRAHGRNLITAVRPGTNPSVNAVTSSVLLRDLAGTICWRLQSVVLEYRRQQPSDPYRLCSFVTNRDGERYFVEGDVVKPVDDFDLDHVLVPGTVGPVAFFYTATDGDGSVESVQGGEVAQR